MKKIFASQNLTECDLVRSLLHGSGVQTMLKNEYTSRTAGAGPVGGLPFAWPEVWVNDKEFEHAQTSLKDAGLSFLHGKK